MFWRFRLTFLGFQVLWVLAWALTTAKEATVFKTRGMLSMTAAIWCSLLAATLTDWWQLWSGTQPQNDWSLVAGILASIV
jgi:hypothetical protein